MSDRDIESNLHRQLCGSLWWIEGTKGKKPFLMSPLPKTLP